MSDSNFIERLLRVVSENDIHSYLFWSDKLEFFINCNDFFWWGCADLEPIKYDDDMALLLECLGLDGTHGPLLYCARKRQMRPQGAYYKYIGKDLWPLFDACGPVREKGIGNPYNPGEY